MKIIPFIIYTTLFCNSIQLKAEQYPFSSDCSINSGNPFYNKTTGIRTNVAAQYQFVGRVSEEYYCGVSFQSIKDTNNYIVVNVSYNSTPLNVLKSGGLNHYHLLKKEEIEKNHITSFGTYVRNNIQYEWAIIKQFYKGRHMAAFTIVFQLGKDVVEIALVCREADFTNELCAVKAMTEYFEVADKVIPAPVIKTLKTYYDTGELYSTITTSDGLYSGEYVIYYKTGKVKYSTFFEKGNQTKNVVEYNERGELVTPKDSLYTTSPNHFKGNSYAEATFCFSGKDTITSAWWNNNNMSEWINSNCLIVKWKTPYTSMKGTFTVTVGVKLEADLQRFYFYDYVYTVEGVTR